MRFGYKQTEVGVIPEDWSVRPLLSTLHLPVGQVDPRREPYSSMVLVAPDHVESKTGRLVAKETASEQRAISGKYLFETGDLVYSKIRPYLRKVILSDFDGLCSADMYPLRPAPNVSGGFMLAVLLGRHFSDFAEAVSARSGIPKINRAELAEYRVALPPFAEQQAIAEALSDADALIESLEQLLAKKRQVRQGAMQELLTGKRRLSGFSGEWEERRLGELARIKTGERNNQDKVEGGEYPFFVRSATVERINSFSHDCEAVLVPGEGGIDSIFHYVRGRFDVHQRVYAITEFVPEAHGKFIYFYMAEKFGAHAMQNSVKATVDSLRLPTFQSFEMKIPGARDEQAGIALVLSDLDEEVTALEAKRDKARAVKVGMMQRLLTGRIRLV